MKMKKIKVLMHQWASQLKSLILMNNNSMYQKLTVIFIVLLLPISLSAFISFKNYTESIEKNTTDYVNQIALEMLDKLDQYIEDMRSITKVPMYLPDLQKSLMDPQRGSAKSEKIDFYIRLMADLKKDTSAVYILDNFGDVYFGMRSDYVREDISTRFDEWRRLADTASGSSFLINTQPIKLNSDNKYVFTVVRNIRDTTATIPFKTIGLVAVEMNINVIDETVRRLDLMTGGKTIIVDENNVVIFDSLHKEITQKWSETDSIAKSQGESGNFLTVQDNVEYYGIYNSSRNTGWKVYNFIKTEDLFAKAIKNRNITLITTTAITLFALLLCLLVSFALTKPLRKLAMLMKSVQEGDLNVSFPVKYKDEVGVLGINFNRMIRRINELIHEIYHMGNRKKEAELEALQAQINPHFIYNTLETIRMKALLNEDREVSEMTLILSKLLRYSILNGIELATIKLELEHLQNYIKIQNYRFDNRFSLIIETHSNLDEYKLIKLVIQPIVENAIFHGIENNLEAGMIKIGFAVNGDQLWISVEDNGIGMNSDQLSKLMKKMNSSAHDNEKGTNNIGLRNVNERIKLYYGEQYGLEIFSELGKGTRVVMKLPLNPKGENDDAEHHIGGR